jgi:hypothetical protein
LATASTGAGSIFYIATTPQSGRSTLWLRTGVTLIMLGRLALKPRRPTVERPIGWLDVHYGPDNRRDHQVDSRVSQG